MWWLYKQYCAFHGKFKGRQCEKCIVKPPDIPFASSWYY